MRGGGRCGKGDQLVRGKVHRISKNKNVGGFFLGGGGGRIRGWEGGEGGRGGERMGYDR